MTPPNSGLIEAWVPRDLIEAPRRSEQWGVTAADGLVAVAVAWRDGVIHRIEALSSRDASPSCMLLPRLVEPHAHLDKAFSWSDYPNLSGTYDGAMEANLREHQTRTVELVHARGERGLQLACRHGLRAIRSHIDSLGPGAACSWEALLDLRQQWSDRIALQLVALVPVEHWSTPDGERLAAWIATKGGLLGGVIPSPCPGREMRAALRRLLELAETHGCGVDLHLDEADAYPAAGMGQLLRSMDGLSLSVPITCSHASSLAMLGMEPLRRLAARIEEHQLQVVALPLTNGWLLGRRGDRTPYCRPLAPIRQLQRAGVCVAVGGDNIQDCWFPGGNLDPLALMAASLFKAHLAPWEQLGLDPFTREAARLMGLTWDGVMRPGAPADLLLLNASNWSEALSEPPRRRVLINGQWQKALPSAAELQH